MYLPPNLVTHHLSRLRRIVKEKCIPASCTSTCTTGSALDFDKHKPQGALKGQTLITIISIKREHEGLHQSHASLTPFCSHALGQPNAPLVRDICNLNASANNRIPSSQPSQSRYSGFVRVRPTMTTTALHQPYFCTTRI
jgi:hypothetical protein